MLGFFGETIFICFTCMFMIWPKLVSIVNKNRFSASVLSSNASHNRVAAFEITIASAEFCFLGAE